MLEIFNIKDKQEYLQEVCELTQIEWGDRHLTKEEFDSKVKKKIEKILNNIDNKYYCKLILLDNNKLVGFISIFEHDCDERKNLSPWYATMYVKKEFRGKRIFKNIKLGYFRRSKKKEDTYIIFENNIK